MRARAKRLLGTGDRADVEQAEGFFLNGRRPRDHDDLRLRVEGGVTDVVRERGQIIEQGAQAMDRQAVLAIRHSSRLCPARDGLSSTVTVECWSEPAGT